MKSGRGGSRSGAGRPQKAPTKAIRLDERLAEKILQLVASVGIDTVLDKWGDIEIVCSKDSKPVITEATSAATSAITITPEVLPMSIEFSSTQASDGSGSFLTKEQHDILEAVRDRLTQNPKKGLLVEALAGTGKSTMLAEIAGLLRDNGINSKECRFIVFGRKNKADLAKKLSTIVWENSAQTLNSLGYEILRDALGKGHKQFRLNTGKYQQIAENLGYLDKYDREGNKVSGSLQQLDQNEESAIKSKGDFIDLIDKIRLHCCFLDELKPNDILDICERYNIEIISNKITQVFEAVCDVLEEGLNEGINKQHIDFLDQIWLLWHDQNAYRNIFRKWSNELKIIAIDESQDVDPLQIEFIKLLHNESNNFIIAVGDRFQAIYSFRGAISDGIDVIAKKFNCEKMPLTTNWRCGTKHLRLVREIYPNINIKPSPTAPDGEIRIIKEDKFLSIFDESDRSLSFFGICRKNAPLIIFAIRLITAGYPARIKDRNLGARLLGKIKEVCRSRYQQSEFLGELSHWFDIRCDSLAKLPEKVKEQKLVELRDYRDCLGALFNRFLPESLDDWKQEIDNIFDESETEQKIIDLYTIHSGKGGEGHYTFILYPEQMPIEHPKQSKEEYEQELNMIYVALTRCLARAKGGILWLVLEGNDTFKYPSWLPSEYRILWGENANEQDDIVL